MSLGPRHITLVIGLVAGMVVMSSAYPQRAHGAESLVANTPGGEETLLIDALNDIANAHLDEALSRLENLLRRQPNFRLAQLVYADTLLAKGQQISGFGNSVYGSPALNGAVRDLSNLRDEARMRLQHYSAAPPSDQLPVQLLHLSSATQRVVVVDVSASRLYLFENRSEGLRLIESYYASTGKKGSNKRREGDQKTPVGLYYITGRISASRLPDFYGVGALPVNYPNEWDIRQGHTGYGIWIHGVPTDTYSRAPRASDGCVALANEDLTQFWAALDIDETPVLMVDGVEWVDRERLLVDGTRLVERIDAWRKAWESLSVERYAKFYSAGFQGDTKNFQTWMAHKTRVNSFKTYADVGLSAISILGYPGEADMVVVNFLQDYRSSNFNSKSKKRQYWRQEADGVWRILYEGTPRLRPEHVRGIPYSARSRISSISP